MLDKTYDPKEIEARLYPEWEQSGAFRAHPESPKPPYCIVIPPPNVTGSLHMGHALDNTLQDVLIRWRRMKGDDVLWQPGTDHAGIATQMVVVRNLEQEGIGLAVEGAAKATATRSCSTARNSWPRSGSGRPIRAAPSPASCAGSAPRCDWSRERFTMDEGLSAAVLQGVRRSLQGRADLQGQPAGQLGPQDADRDLRPRGRIARGEGPSLVLQVSDRGQRRAHRRRHDPARDHAGRHRRRGASRRSQVEAPDRQARRSCRWSAGASRSWPTNIPTRRRAPARSRSRRRTTSTISRSAAATSSRRSPSSTSSRALNDKAPEKYRGLDRFEARKKSRGRHGGAGPASRRSSRTPTPCPTAIAAACRSSRS